MLILFQGIEHKLVQLSMNPMETILQNSKESFEENCMKNEKMFCFKLVCHLLNFI